LKTNAAAITFAIVLRLSSMWLELYYPKIRRG
jgi:hypothetical protein